MAADQNPPVRSAGHNAYTFLLEAQHYSDAARIVGDKLDGWGLPAREASFVPYNLACMAIELALKAYLLACDLHRSDLRRLGHDLLALLAKAKEEQLASHATVDRLLERVIACLSPLHAKRGFSYPGQIGYASLVVLRDLLPVVDRLTTQLLPTCKPRSREEWV